MKLLSFLLICVFSYGQNDTIQCNLRVANDNWIEKFENAKTIAEKVKLVKFKIKSDSIFQDNDDPDLYCDYKARFVLRYPKRKRLGVYITNENKFDKLLQKVNATNVKSFDLMKIPYWKRGFYCTDPAPIPRVIIVSINTDSRELKKEIKNYLDSVLDN